MLRIVGIVIDSGHGAELIEPFDQHAFCVKVGKSEGTLNIFHSFGLAPFFYGLQEFRRYFEVVDEIDPTEADIFLVPGGIGTVVDDTCDAPYDFPVFISQKVFGFTKFESRVFLLIECVQHVVVEVRYGIGILFV